MTERVVVFGKTGRLVGVVSEPAARGTRPGIVMLNAGLLHRVGPNRTTVALARRLALGGYPVIRFDLSGIGDSEPRRDELSLERGTLADAREAMDHLAATTGADRFVLVGLCEGAENAFRVAHAEPRVAGAVLIDGYAYPTRGFHIRNWLRHAARLRRGWDYVVGRRDWRVKVRSMLTRANGREHAQEELEAPDLGRLFPPKDAVAGQLRDLMARGVRLLFIYTAIGMSEHYNYAGQLGDTFPFLRGSAQAHVLFMKGIDHTFTLLRHQEMLLEAVEAWARESAPADEDHWPAAASNGRERDR